MASFAPRYARAFADVIRDRRLNATEILQQVLSVEETLDANPQLKIVWRNPAVGSKEKLGLLDAIANRMKLAPEVRNFVAVLIDHRRVGAIGEIVEQFQREINERTGVADAEIVTTRPLDAQEKKQLESQVAAATGKTVRATYREDKSILGGVVVKVGSTIYDGSVRGQLLRLKDQLVAG
jgi:F-type H+-transporting ATPase subunit delta